MKRYLLLYSLLLISVTICAQKIDHRLQVEVEKLVKGHQGEIGVFIKELKSGKTVADTALHLARQQEKLGTAVFSSGYISRNPGGDFKAHHYDMNLVFIDALLQHFKWTGDTAFMREMWPLIKRHLAWEKRNFDQDGDGLYDAYAAIWASDALQYSGGGVTHSSAYNYKANKLAATIALLLGEDARPFQKEATKIHTAINQFLWLPNKGWYAEYKDLLGLKKSA